MFRFGIISASILTLCLFTHLPLEAGKEGAGGVKVDKEKKTITIDAKIAPRKLDIPELKGMVYPIEVIACFAYPKGKKAHETVVTIEANPSVVHKALEELGLKPGTPVMGGKDEPKGPEVSVFLEIPTAGGETKKLSMDKVLVDKNGRPFPKSVKFRFTGGVMKQPDPTKEEKVFAADLTGTLIVIFPVTNETVLQTNLTMEYESTMKLETNTKVLPKEGTPVKLILEVK
jgi:hypothetical protein